MENLTILICFLCFFDTIALVDFKSDSNNTVNANYIFGSFFNFPYGAPSLEILPWIWDAVLDPIDQYVELIFISAKSCIFNKNKWRNLVLLFPEIASKFDNGDENQLFLPQNKEDYFEPIMIQKVFKTGTLLCQFISIDNVISYSVESSVYFGYTLAITTAGNIICPLHMNMTLQNKKLYMNSDQIDTVKLLYVYSKNFGKNQSLNVSTVPFSIYVPNYKFNLRMNPNSNLDSSVTSSKETLPNRHRNDKKSKLIPSSVSSKDLEILNQYNLSICVVINHMSSLQTIEWIEYHKLIGVQHFYIYDAHQNTKTYRNGRINLSYVNASTNFLRPYITEGLVTLIDWRYENCGYNMGATRHFRYDGGNNVGDKRASHSHTNTRPVQHDNTNSRRNHIRTTSRSNRIESFIPPQGVNQVMGISSCYKRFRHTSKYIMLIDNDEFITFPMKVNRNLSSFSDVTYGQYSVTTHDDVISSVKNTSCQNFISIDFDPIENAEYNDLVEYADAVFRNHTKAPAISFSPVRYYPCHQYSSSRSLNNLPSMNEENNHKYVLPRLGIWKHHSAGRVFEGKLLVKTDIVHKTFIHNVLETEIGWENSDVYITKSRTSGLRHYRAPSHLGIVYSSRTPPPHYGFNETCDEIFDFQNALIETEKMSRKSESSLDLYIDHFMKRVPLDDNSKYLLRAEGYDTDLIKLPDKAKFALCNRYLSAPMERIFQEVNRRVASRLSFHKK